MRLVNFLKIICRGVSQVMLQNNIITGILFLVGIFYNSWIMGVGALIGDIIGTFTAYILKYDKKDIEKGYYGFNGTLVGIAMFFFFKINLLTIVILIIGAILSSLVMNFMHTRKLSPYTFPFVLSTWILMILIKIFHLIPARTALASKIVDLNIISALSMGFGQIMFQANIITGIIFFIAILVNSRINAIYSFIGSAIGVLVALLCSFPMNLVTTGIFGFNGVLCGIAFADKKRFSMLFAITAIIISVFIIFGMLSINMIALTSPFVFATWITLGFRKIIRIPSK